MLNIAILYTTDGCSYTVRRTAKMYTKERRVRSAISATSGFLVYSAENSIPRRLIDGTVVVF